MPQDGTLIQPGMPEFDECERERASFDALVRLNPVTRPQSREDGTPYCSIDQLMELRRRFLQDCKLDLYERLMANGTLSTHLHDKAMECLEEAHRIGESGAYGCSGHNDPQAWEWSIRSVICESTWD